MEFTVRFSKETLKGFFIGIVLSSVVWSPIYYFSSKPSEQNNQPQQAAANQPQAAAPTAAPAKAEFNLTDADHLRGPKNAPVTLVEFSDFQCPYCGRHHETMKQIKDAYGDQVAWVWKQFPLTGLHPFAQKAAEASECASEQGKFWEYADKLFENQTSFNNDLFVKLAGDLKLDAAKFKSCLDSDKYLSKVQADESEGASKGVEGTPATFVNGELISGAIPFESFKTIIDEALKNVK
ncbi:MAG: DsbA family protein [bacterium]|nr:DsbA family protein [bacterium]